MSNLYEKSPEDSDPAYLFNVLEQGLNSFSGLLQNNYPGASINFKLVTIHSDEFWNTENGLLKEACQAFNIDITSLSMFYPDIKPQDFGLQNWEDQIGDEAAYKFALAKKDELIARLREASDHDQIAYLRLNVTTTVDDEELVLEQLVKTLNQTLPNIYFSKQYTEEHTNGIIKFSWMALVASGHDE